MKGTQRIKRVIDKFATFVKELDKGIAEIDDETSFNNSVIAGLQTKNAALSETRATAVNVAANLGKLISS